MSGGDTWSTALDKWTWEQLRTMTIGGNAAAREYFNKYPTVDTKDAKAKYSSKYGITYKEKLSQKVKEDMLASISTPRSASSATPGASSTLADDDFFSSWDQPKSSPISPSSLTSPQSVSSPGAASRLSSSSISRTSTARPVKSTLTPVRKSGTASKPMKLGVKKVETTSFEAAEARARAEAGRIEKLGFEAAEEERLQKIATDKAKAEAVKAGSMGSSNGGAGGGGGGGSANMRTNYYQPNSMAEKSRTSSEDMERLGMGVGRMAFGAVPSSKPSAMRSGFGSTGNASPDVEENVTAAREKFGNQKAISSDQYFGRNHYDAEAQNEATGRLQAFSGATSISSNQYFGRPDEQPGVGPDMSLSSLTSLSTSDLAKKLGQADLATLKNAVQTGAGKLTDIIQDMQARYNYL
ncbi:ADP-ribosylation factor GTPase activating protein, ER-Golgi transport [Lunasporangiospora selenospora]|uniref:ADP-ribosylation factor GTPase activating protein, ER-Golgi transport n=1 Tax=Lunasporangiospora selenospora TaxID=979761 RepID=A0A9P6FRH3_9FUNG|nr:ADP-ribosylation factor GTPase activating protein, ER-Golgi transport [Lunasporangiospora selenospora]